MMALQKLKIWSRRSIFHAPDFIKDSVDLPKDAKESVVACLLVSQIQILLRKRDIKTQAILIYARQKKPQPKAGLSNH